MEIIISLFATDLIRKHWMKKTIRFIVMKMKKEKNVIKKAVANKDLKSAQILILL
ncbi:MAG: hypothetical protein AAB437_01850 [Patescibacteria group bacterium]